LAERSQRSEAATKRKQMPGTLYSTKVSWRLFFWWRCSAPTQQWSPCAKHTVLALARKTSITTIRRRSRFLLLINTCMLKNIRQIVRNAPRPHSSPRCRSRTVEALLDFRRCRKIREFFSMITQFPNLTYLPPPPHRWHRSRLNDSRLSILLRITVASGLFLFPFVSREFFYQGSHVFPP
jgi:hypothetical protein